MGKLPYHQWLELFRQELESRDLANHYDENAFREEYDDGSTPEQAADGLYESLAADAEEEPANH